MLVRSSRALLAALSVVVATAACGDVPRDGDGYIPQELLAQTLLLTLSQDPPNVHAPPFSVRLVVEASLTEKGTLMLLAYGAEAEGTYELEGDTLTVTFPAYELGQTRLPRSASFCPDVLEVEGLTFILTVTREHGSIDAVQGTARGSVSRWLDDDAPISSTRTFSVMGVREHEAPIEPAQGEGLHPLDTVEVYVGGRVIADHFSLLQSGADVPFDTMMFAQVSRQPVSLPVVLYRRVHERPLTWGASYAIAPGMLEMDSQNRRIRAASFTTLPAPASFDTPDFEGPVHVVLRGGARISSPADGAFHAPLEGEQALSLSSSGSATFAFPAPQAVAPTNLVMRVRYHTASYLPYDVPEILGVVFFDDAEIVRALAAPDSTFAVEGINTSGGTAIATLTVPLPDLARTGEFSLLVGTSHLGSCGGTPLPRGEAVLEELRLE